MTNPKSEPPARVFSHLTSKEEAAYRCALRDNDPFLSPNRQAQLYELYLNGMSCEEIARYAKGVRLGQVVRACVDGDWYNKKAEYIERLLGTVTGQLQQVQTEAVLFAATCLRVAHKQHGEAMLRYIESGDTSGLTDFAAKNFGQYQKMVELVLKLTGQDRGLRWPLGGLPPPAPGAKPVAGAAIEGGEDPEVLEAEAAKPILAAPGPMELVMSGPPTTGLAADLIKALYNQGGKA